MRAKLLFIFSLLFLALAALTQAQSITNLKNFTGVQSWQLNASASGGAPPYTYAWFNSTVGNPACNPANQMLAATQPDVLVVHSNGIMVGYDAIANTDQSRGDALVAAAANAVNGDSIWLKAETYNLQGNTIDESIGTSLLPISSQQSFSIHGAGKYQTTLQMGIGSVQAGTNSQTTDLSIIGISPEAQLGMVTAGIAKNITIRNVYLQGFTYPISWDHNPDQGSIYNSTIVGNNIGVFLESAFGTNYQRATPPMEDSLNIYDSKIIGITGGNVVSLEGNSSTLYGIQNIGGEVNAINLTTQFIDPHGLLSGTVGIDTESSGISAAGFNGVTNIYGGTINTIESGNSIINNNAAGSETFINATTQYNSLTAIGTISNTLGPYGPYTYDRSPVPAPRFNPFTSNRITVSPSVDTWYSASVTDAGGNTICSPGTEIGVPSNSSGVPMNLSFILAVIVGVCVIVYAFAESKTLKFLFKYAFLFGFIIVAFQLMQDYATETLLPIVFYLAIVVFMLIFIFDFLAFIPMMVDGIMKATGRRR